MSNLPGKIYGSPSFRGRAAHLPPLSPLHSAGPAAGLRLRSYHQNYRNFISFLLAIFPAASALSSTPPPFFTCILTGKAPASNDNTPQ